ncbi:PolC-type DNA polymerase III [Peptoniphilus equinus]|uniref:DNA polymerase III PolC-type n=1 Tax=Peptoniphilus equinus TaxID=3016343 RepID=A0ABY7QV55_9FIRM|nr:PolC-type DNA polymerase III [Peptoniphilus equinus]WBW50674.1 PolC-type DNA polymerase III [Peptoniphilus equinus]
MDAILNKLNIGINLKWHYVLSKVKLNRSSMTVIFLFTTEHEDKSEQQLILQALQTYLEGFEVKAEFVVEHFDDPVLVIKNMILEYNPSSTLWLEKLDITLDDLNGVLSISAPSEEIYFTMTANGLTDLLLQELAVYGIQDVRFLNPKTTYVCDTDVLNDKIKNLADEEKNLVKDTTISREIAKPAAEEGAATTFHYGKKDVLPVTPIADLNLEYSKVTIQGTVFKVDVKELKDSKFIYTLAIHDDTGSYYAKFFLSEDKARDFDNSVKVGTAVVITGSPQYDKFIHEESLMIKYLEVASGTHRTDSQEIKRIELRLHSKMSTMNGVTSFEDYAALAHSLGMTALAITDKGDVQGFPEAMFAGQKYGLKILYGLDANYVDDRPKLLMGTGKVADSFTVFDIETTGFSPVYEDITEIGAVKIENGQVVARYSQLIKPRAAIPEAVQKLTGITPDLVSDKPYIEEVIGDFYEFTKGTTLVAHNAAFDSRFIKREFKRAGYKFDFQIIDTLNVARAIVDDVKRYNLSALCKKFGISLVGAHRAVNDAEATAHLFIKLMDLAREDIDDLNALNQLSKRMNPAILFESPVSLLVQNNVGLKHLYKLVSASHLKYVSRMAKVPRSLIEKYREGILVGSGTKDSDVFQAVLNGEDDTFIKDTMKFYDYIELQPPSDQLSLIKEGMVRSLDEIKGILRKIYMLAKELGKPVVATGDVFYQEPEDDLVRRIILSSSIPPARGAKERNSLYFKTTDDMLREFAFLGERESYEVVVEATNKLADSIETLDPIPEGTYPPSIEGAEEILRTMCYDKAHAIYGAILPEIVDKRLEVELNSIIKHGYAVLYVIAQKLVHKSNQDGYLVGSRGSVGSSFAATMASITEVNPLPPHYVCPQCQYSEFFTHGEVGSGVDLEDKMCPVCGAPLTKDGHDIPFEVFLGFNGDKEPDIDLNFAGEYQSVAHKYTEELFGQGYVFRAGTIGTVAERTAYGYVKKFFEGQPMHKAEVDRLVTKLMGIKRTSGQHPGGVMICPKSKEIYDFTPIQHPADDLTSSIITTHFDYNFIHGKILKLDILGHDGPTIIRSLEDFTGVDASTIPLNDPTTLSLFQSAEALHLNADIFETPTGTLGIPEFGTGFVKQMLLETKPKNFSDLVRISGLSHGTDVWTNNAQNLVRDKRAELSDVISTREDIMTYLIHAGAENKMAFDTMEKVRKGKGLTSEQKQIMSKLPLPEWYIEACEKIKYMFPKAHAVAYVMQSFRIAWYKINYPLAYYATYFRIKLNDFDGELVLKGPQAVKEHLDELKSIAMPTAKDKGQMTVLEIVLEMFARGLEFCGADIYESEVSRFVIKESKILMPLRAFMGVGESVASQIVSESHKGRYLSIEDFCKRTKTGKSTVEILKRNGLLKGFEETNQISLFNL